MTKGSGEPAAVNKKVERMSQQESAAEKTYESFALTYEGAVAIITLNRPDRANAFMPGFSDELYDVLSTVADEKISKVLLIRAEGKIFSAGAHWDLLNSWDTTAKSNAFVTTLGKAIGLLSSMSKPVIAEVAGAAAGGAAGLALSCDFVMISDKAKFVFPFINLGLFPDTGGLWALVQRLGVPRAKEIAMRGLTLTAAEANESGLVNHMVPVDDLQTEAMNLAQELAKKPVRAMAAIKDLCNKIPEMTHDTFTSMEASTLTVLPDSADHREGVAAAQEKREPNFTGDE